MRKLATALLASTALLATALPAQAVTDGSLDEDAHPYVAASPSARVHADAPPFMVLHGTGDAIVVPAQSRAFVARLRAVSRAPVVHAELARAQAGFDLVPTARTLATVRAVGAFLEAVVGAGRRTGVGPGVGDATGLTTAPTTAPSTAPAAGSPCRPSAWPPSQRSCGSAPTRSAWSAPGSRWKTPTRPA